jgi:hypothetical protein
MVRIPDGDDQLAFLALFKGESGRAAAVLGGAYLDARLEETLRTWLEQDVDELFKPGGALWNSRARVQVARALGAITKGYVPLFRALGDIRNHFAHHVLDATWDHPKVKRSMGTVRQITSLQDGFTDRDTYVVAVGALSAQLRGCEKAAVLEKRKKAVVQAVKKFRSPTRVKGKPGR